MVIRLRLGTRGSLQLPLLLAMVMIVLGGFGIWGFMRNWRFLMETQLRLDKCVGVAAQEFRGALNSLMTDNQRVQALRAAILAAELQPELIPPLKVTLQVVVAKQEFTLIQWKIKTGKWLVSRGCGKWKDWAIPLPSLEFIREPPDSIGPKALRWAGQSRSEFFFQVEHSPRASAARVEGGCLEWKLDCKGWISNWTSPQRDWTSFH